MWDWTRGEAHISNMVNFLSHSQDVFPFLFSETMLNINHKHYTLSLYMVPFPLPAQSFSSSFFCCFGESAST